MQITTTNHNLKDLIKELNQSKMTLLDKVSEISRSLYFIEQSTTNYIDSYDGIYASGFSIQMDNIKENLENIVSKFDTDNNDIYNKLLFVDKQSKKNF